MTWGRPINSKRKIMRMQFISTFNFITLTESTGPIFTHSSWTSASNSDRRFSSAYQDRRMSNQGWHWNIIWKFHCWYYIANNQIKWGTRVTTLKSDNICWKINREKREIDSYVPSLHTSSLTNIILPYRPQQDNAVYHKVRDLKPFRSSNKKFLEKLFVDNTFDCLGKHIQKL